MHPHRLLQWHRVNGEWKPTFRLIYATSCRWPKAGFISKDLCVSSNRKSWIPWACSVFTEWGHYYLKLQVLYIRAPVLCLKDVLHNLIYSTVLTSSWGYFLVAEVEGMEIFLFTPNRGENVSQRLLLRAWKNFPTASRKLLLASPWP